MRASSRNISMNSTSGEAGQQPLDDEQLLEAHGPLRRARNTWVPCPQRRVCAVAQRRRSPPSERNDSPGSPWAEGHPLGKDGGQPPRRSSGGEVLLAVESVLALREGLGARHRRGAGALQHVGQEARISRAGQARRIAVEARRCSPAAPWGLLALAPGHQPAGDDGGAEAPRRARSSPTATASTSVTAKERRWPPPDSTIRACADRPRMVHGMMRGGKRCRNEGVRGRAVSRDGAGPREDATARSSSASSVPSRSRSAPSASSVLARAR